jgi:hypothetical protein
MGKTNGDKPRSYSKFTEEDIADLGLQLLRKQLFTGVPVLQPSEYLAVTLGKNRRRRLRSEKSKSEFIIAPVLAEIEEHNADKLALYSGYQFNVDKATGLQGFCDYIFSKDPDSYAIAAPVLCIVEAKNDNLDNGLPQCVAAMYAAQIFNKDQGKPLKHIYGAVTTGFDWLFLQLEDNTAFADTDVYQLSNLPQILGILNHISQ